MTTDTQQLPYAGEIEEAMRRAEAAAASSRLSKADRLDAQHVHDLLGKLKAWGQAVCALDATPHTRLPGPRQTGDLERQERPQKAAQGKAGRVSVARVRKRLVLTQGRLEGVREMVEAGIVEKEEAAGLMARLEDEAAWLRLLLGPAR